MARKREKRPKVQFYRLLRKMTTFITFVRNDQIRSEYRGVLSPDEARGQRNPGYSCCPEGDKLAQNVILSLFALMTRARRQRVKKVTILDARASKREEPHNSGFLRADPLPG